MMGEDELLLERSSMEKQPESQELMVPSGPQPALPPHPEQDDSHELSAVTVLTLLDQLVKMLDGVQEKQLRMEEWQLAMEGSVRNIQNDMSKLLKSNNGAVNSVSKLLEKNRKISAVMKDVRAKMERQAAQVRKLEDNHTYLLHRDNFRVLIFQDENEIPSSVFLKDSSHDAESEAVTLDTNRSQEEAELYTVQLSSDEDLDEEEDEEELMEEMEPMEKSRTDKLKRSSLKRVDSLKKAFSRENIEKKMNKIVSAEKRQKIKQSLSQKNKGSSFKIFKKIREGEEPSESFTEIHAQLAPAQEEHLEKEDGPAEKEGGADHTEGSSVEKAEVEEDEEVLKVEEVLKGEVSLDATADGDRSIIEDVSAEYALSDTLPQETSHLSHNALQNEPEKEEEEDEKGAVAERVAEHE